MFTEIPHLSWFFLLLFTINGISVILILLFKNRILKSTQFLLAINLLGVTFASIVICLVETRFILKVPFLFRLPSPLYYLMFPAAYLYVKLIITDRVSLKKNEFLHFLPALVHLIEMLPYYLKTNAEKILIIDGVINHDIKIYAHSEGWFPPYVHNIIRGVLALVYAIAMWRLISISRINQESSYKIFYGKTLQWLKIFTIMNGVIGIVVIESMTFTFIPSELRSLSIHFTFITVLIISNYYLLFHPEILYGHPKFSFSKLSVINVVEEKSPLENSKFETATLQDDISSEAKNISPLLAQYRIQINKYIIQSQIYLQPDFSITDLSRNTKIPVHHLRLLINKQEGLRFNDFINQYRMDHMQTLINNGALANKTLETLAFESGFSSKPAFIRGIKKLTQQTPGVYFNERKV